jgi:hypothetical protein
MAFPSTPAPTYSFTVEPEWKTTITDLDGDNEQRREWWDFPHYNVKMTWGAIEPSEMRALWDHYMSMHGAARAFNYFVPVIDTYNEPLYVGLGDGATKIFDLPAKSSSEQSIYVDGQILESGVAILTGGGEDGVDRVQFSYQPGDNQVISCKLTGFLRIRCRYSVDKLSKELFAYMLYKTGVELKGLGPLQ